MHDDPPKRRALGAALPDGVSALLVGASDGFYEWEIESDELYWSRSMCEVLGVDPEAFVPRSSTFFERVHPDDRESIEQRLTAHLERGEPYVVQHRIRHEDGRYLKVQGHGVAQRDATGKPLRLIGIMRDLSAQDALARQLDDTRSLFASLAQNIPGAIFRYVLAPDGADRIEQISEGCLELFELAADTIEADAGKIWRQILPEHLAGTQASVQRSGATLTPWDHTFEIECPSGRRKWIHGRGTPVMRDDGSIEWASMCLDVTARVRAEGEAAKAHELLSQVQRLESLAQLTGGLAHDFNNLLSVVTSSLETLEELGSSEERQEVIDDALDAVERGAQLTRRLLTFSKKARLEPQRLDLADVVREMEGLMRRSLPAEVALELQLPNAARPVNLDRAALENALLNLVLNARDALPSGGAVTVRVDSEGDQARVSVHDTGEGMSEEVRARALEPFFTTKPVDQGTGLGLATVDGFVKQSKGALTLDSAPGRGTAVTLSFPAAVGAPSTSDTEFAGESSGRVLVVEDEPSLRRAFARQLQRAGFEVRDAANADEALSVLERETFDLLLTDVQMPGSLFGDDLARRALDEGRVNAAILVSGNPSPGVLDEADGANRMRALLKPLGRDALLTHVRELLAHRSRA